MDYKELDLPNEEILSNSNMDLPSSCSMDSFFDEILKDTHACSHLHTCNPPLGPDLSHTHTCVHIHSHKKVVPQNRVSANDPHTADSSEEKSKKRPLGNREAVRKYREKKKARTASLEDEVVHLRAVNQELEKRLQDQAALHGEILRLRCLLADIRGRIEGELGGFPYQKPGKGGGDMYPNMGGTQNFPGAAYVMNPCNVRHEDAAYCFHLGAQGKDGEYRMVNGHEFGGCDFENLQCAGNQIAGCGVETGASAANPSAANKRKGNRGAAAS